MSIDIYPPLVLQLSGSLTFIDAGLGTQLHVRPKDAPWSLKELETQFENYFNALVTEANIHLANNPKTNSDWGTPTETVTAEAKYMFHKAGVTVSMKAVSATPTNHHEAMQQMRRIINAIADFLQTRLKEVDSAADESPDADARG